MKRDRLKNYTVEDLLKYNYVSPIVVKHDPYPSTTKLCPYDWYASKGMLRGGHDMEGELEEILPVITGKPFKDAMMLCMKHMGGRCDPNVLKSFLVLRGFSIEEKN